MTEPVEHRLRRQAKSKELAKAAAEALDLGCLEVETLHRLFADELSVSEAIAARRHLTFCDDCAAHAVALEDTAAIVEARAPRKTTRRLLRWSVALAAALLVVLAWPTTPAGAPSIASARLQASVLRGGDAVLTANDRFTVADVVADRDGQLALFVYFPAMDQGDAVLVPLQAENTSFPLLANVPLQLPTWNVGDVLRHTQPIQGERLAALLLISASVTNADWHAVFDSRLVPELSRVFSGSTWTTTTTEIEFVSLAKAAGLGAAILSLRLRSP